MADASQRAGGPSEDRRGADPARVESLYRRALEARAALLGPDHAVVGQDAKALGAFLARQKRHDEARALLTDALRIYEAFLGANHLQVADLSLALADLDLDQGRADEETGKRVERCLAIVEASSEPKPALLAKALDAYARYLTGIGMTDRAQEVSARAAAVRGAEQ